jgi:hypothetical protein
MGFQKPYALFPCFFVICERTSRSYGGGFNVQLWVSKNPTLSSLNSLLIVSALAAVTVEALMFSYGVPKTLRSLPLFLCNL